MAAGLPLLLTCSFLTLKDPGVSLASALPMAMVHTLLLSAATRPPPCMEREPDTALTHCTATLGILSISHLMWATQA